MGDFGKDRGVSIGGEHDAGVPEHILDDFQVGSGGQGEAGGAVTEVVQAYGRQAAGVVEPTEVAREPVRRHGVTIEPGKHVTAVAVIFAGRGALSQLA
jgi:hypothetical protein